VVETANGAPRDIHLLTTDALLAELVAGRPVATGASGLLSITSGDARAVLDWYRRNPAKWVTNLNAGDTDAIIDLIGSPPPVAPPPSEGAAAGGRRVFQLVKVEAHRFAGLHVHGRSDNAPDRFVFMPGKPVTLFEGANGSGKTSVANAIVWCLTGHLIRSQRPPEQGPVEFPCEITRADGSVTRHPMSAITPMPHSGSDLPEDGKPIRADTWVELTFADEDGNPMPAIRREQSRKASGKIFEAEPDFSGVAVDPIAWRIATTMPALLPFLAVGSASQLGEAVARLTGLADLVDLARHAEKLSERVAKKSTKDLEADVLRIASQYEQAAGDLRTAIADYPDMAIQEVAPAVADEDAKARLQELLLHFVTMKSTAMAAARDVLGNEFDPEDRKARDDLEASIRPAVEQLTRHLSDLPSIARLSGLQIDGEGFATIVALLHQIDGEAATLAELAGSPDRARRAQLYARVSAWMHEHSHPDDGTCPLCVAPLAGVQDPITGSSVADHLAEAARDRETVARTVAEWSTHWCGRLLQELPAGISAELRRDLPASPIALLRKGVIDDLFATEPFTGALSALKTDAAALFDERATHLPAFKEPDLHTLPPNLQAAAPLQQMIERIVRVMAFAGWRTSSAEDLKKILFAVRNGEDGAADVDRALKRRLMTLLSIVEGVAPLNAAIDYTGRMEIERVAHAGKVSRIAACGRVVAALAGIVPLGALAQTQVDTLRTKLHNRSEFWRKAMFRNATDFAPDLVGTGMDAKGVLELKVGRQGASAPAQHVSNASALRGALLGFFLAFREHVLATRGGLATLLLDDPQELLDNDNRERLARGLTKLASTGVQLVVTTHDRKFARAIVAENRSEDAIEHLSVHPVNTVRPTIGLSPAIEEVDRKREAFRSRPDDAICAQDYASDLRVFLEGRLGDLFDDVAHPAFAAPSKALTLNPLMDKLRALVATGEGELFNHPAVKRFASHPALASGAEPRRVLNETHHDKASITYMDVKAVEGSFAQLRTAIEDVHQQFRLYRWREPLASAGVAGGNVMSLHAMSRPTFSVPLCPDIAAFVGSASEGGSQDVAVERVDGSWFDGKTLYYIRGDTLGFAIPSGSVAIVDAEPYPGRDQNLVIARHGGQVFARRLIRSPNSIGVSLAAQLPDPRTPRPSLTFDESKLRLHRIVGSIFTDMPPPAGGNEAGQVSEVPELSQVAIAYCVREESAIPLALPGQIILGGAEINATQLDLWEGHLVAVTLADGSSLFKRVGRRLAGGLAHLRQFESIGGLGSSIVVTTEGMEGADTPVMISARRVIGVLYED
jgi:hypothetical protein